MYFRRRMCGLSMLTFGAGMFFGLVLNTAAIIIAAALLIAGFWLLFM